MYFILYYNNNKIKCHILNALFILHIKSLYINIEKKQKTNFFKMSKINLNIEKRNAKNSCRKNEKKFQNVFSMRQNKIMSNYKISNSYKLYF